MTFEDMQGLLEAMPDVNVNMPDGGAELANWAPGFKSKKSSRKRSGAKKAQGLASSIVAPTGAWAFRT
jgi:hypothetical protein